MAAALLIAAVLHLINAQRAAHHEPPLRVSPLLQAEAQRHRGISHSRVRACDGVRGQNLAWATYPMSPRRAVELWLASPPHRANLLGRRYRFTGISVRRQGRLTIYTQDFAQRCNN